MTTITDDLSEVPNDGTLLYLESPKEIRIPRLFPTSEVIDGLLEDEQLQEGDLKSVILHGSRGWMVQCTSPEVARRATGRAINVRGYTAILSYYQAGGASVLIADHIGIGTTPRDIVEGIAQIELLQTEKIGFWLGLQEHKGIKGRMAVVAFDRYPDFYRMEIPVAIPGTGEPEDTFRIRFRTASLTGDKCPVDRCPVCRRAGSGRHSITQCPMLRTVFIPSHDLPDKCYLLDQPPLSALGPVQR